MFSFLSYSKKRKISLSHQPLLHDSQSEKSDYIIKRFIGKKSNQYLLFSLPRRVRDHIHPWKRNTCTDRSLWSNVIKWMVTWRRAFYNNFRLTARFSLLVLIFRGGGEGCGTKGEVKLTSKVTPPHSLYNYIHNKYMNLVSKKWLYKQTYKPSFEELHKYPNLINLWEDKKWLKYIIINFLAQCQGVKLTFFFW